MANVRRVIVCSQALAAQANVVAKRVDTVGGEFTFTVPLRAAGDATNTVVARWCSWWINVVDLASLKTKALAAGFGAAETSERLVGFVATPATLPRLCLFDDAAWTPAQVLAALGLDTLVAP